jgi:aryl-alcohol dehydrogenase-like predicted oxidoreductase
MSTETRPVAQSGTFTIGQKTVHRLGYGTMRLPGKGVWGYSPDPDEAVRVLRRAVELGVQLIDTADSYGPETADELLRKALHPYPADLLIATKAGLTRQGPDRWHPVGVPAYLRQSVELSLRRLGLEAIELFQLHRIDSKVPAEDQFGLLRDLRDEGKVVNVGLSEVSVAEIEAARAIVPIATVQNRFNPWYPIAGGRLTEPGGALAEVAERHGASAPQVALAWLLGRSDVILPIPGTSSVAHVEENCAAALLELTADDRAILDRP